MMTGVATRYLVHDFGYQVIPDALSVPSEFLEKDVFDRWYRVQVERCRAAFSAGDEIPEANSDGIEPHHLTM